MGNSATAYRQVFSAFTLASYVVKQSDPTVYDNETPNPIFWFNEANDSVWAFLGRDPTTRHAQWVLLTSTDPMPNLGIQFAVELDVPGTYLLAPYTAYYLNAPGVITLELPLLCPQGATFKVIGRMAPWSITQTTANHQVEFNGINTTQGVSGSLTPLTNTATLTLSCAVANDVYTVEAATGNFDLI